MQSIELNPLKGLIHVDEFVFGGKEVGCPVRRNESEKQRFAVALEIIKHKKKFKWEELMR